jgi:hypothetical protein
MTTTNKTDGVPETALFVCFGGMSNVGTLTGLAGLEAVKQAGPGEWVNGRVAERGCL